MDPKRSNRIEQFCNQALERKPPEASLLLPRLAWPKAPIAEKSSLPSCSAIVGTTFNGDQHRHTSRLCANYGTPWPWWFWRGLSRPRHQAEAGCCDQNSAGGILAG